MSEIKNPNPPEKYWMVTRFRNVGEWYFEAEEEARAFAKALPLLGREHAEVDKPETDWQRWEMKPKPETQEGK